MIIFRSHRMGLTYPESMQEAREFNDEQEMKKAIVEKYHEGWIGEPEILFTVDDIVIDHDSETEDKITKWEDLKYVCVKRMGDEVYETPQCIGFCATKYEPLN